MGEKKWNEEKKKNDSNASGLVAACPFSVRGIYGQIIIFMCSVMLATNTQRKWCGMHTTLHQTHKTYDSRCSARSGSNALRESSDCNETNYIIKKLPKWQHLI